MWSPSTSNSRNAKKKESVVGNTGKVQRAAARHLVREETDWGPYDKLDGVLQAFSQVPQYNELEGVLPSFSHLPQYNELDCLLRAFFTFLNTMNLIACYELFLPSSIQ